MAHPDTKFFLLNKFFKSLRKKACEACLFTGYICKSTQKTDAYARKYLQNLCSFTNCEKYFLHTHIG